MEDFCLIGFFFFLSSDESCQSWFFINFLSIKNLKNMFNRNVADFRGKK